jgi:hypothetical protein
MKNKIIYIFILVLNLTACNKDNTNNTLSGKWKLVKYHNLTNKTSECEPLDISRSIIIEFFDDGITGKIDGKTVSNTVGGVFELSQENKMKTISFNGTKIGEPKWGVNFGMQCIMYLHMIESVIGYSFSLIQTLSNWNLLNNNTINSNNRGLNFSSLFSIQINSI